MLFLLHVSTNWPEGLKGTYSIWQKSSSEMSWKTKRKWTCRAVWSPAYISLYYRWIKLSFWYVVLITRIYEMTGVIERNVFHLTEIIIGNVLKNKKEMHLQGSLVAGRFISVPPLDQAKFLTCCSYYTYLLTDRRDWEEPTLFDSNHHRKVPEKQKGNAPAGQFGRRPIALSSTVGSC